MAELTQVHALATRIEEMARQRDGISHAEWFDRQTNADGRQLRFTTEYLTSQLEMLRGLVRSGAFAAMSFERGAITMVTQPVEIEYDGHTYNMGVYTITIAPADMTLGNGTDGLNERTIRISGGRLIEGSIHPHLAPTGGCLGSGRAPLVEALRNQAWADAFLLIDTLLNSYNENSPMRDIEAWGNRIRCGECNGGINADEPTRVEIDGRVYHRDCTTTVTSQGDQRFRLRDVQVCYACGRSQFARNIDHAGRGCTECTAFFVREQEAARRGSAICHNCEAEYDHEHVDQAIALPRGDRVCQNCTVVTESANPNVRTVLTSRRWNAVQLLGQSFNVQGSRSFLRPNCATMNRSTPAIRIPQFAVCSCTVRRLSHEITPCKLIDGQTRCLTCDPGNTGLSAQAQNNPITGLALVTDWINQNIDSRVLYFFDFIHPATVSSDTLKQSIIGVLAANQAHMQPANRNAKTIVDFMNAVLRYPAITATSEMIGIYDTNYNRRAPAVA